MTANKKIVQSDSPDIQRLVAQANDLCAIDLCAPKLKVKVSSLELSALAPAPTQKTFRIIKDAAGSVTSFPAMIRKEE